MTIGIAPTKQKQTPVEIEQQIFHAIQHIKYGSVEIVIHDGKVVQIECREKIRIDYPG